MRTKWAQQDDFLRTALVKGCLPVTNSVPTLTLGLLKRTFGTFLRVQDRKMVSPLFSAARNKISQGSN